VFLHLSIYAKCLIFDILITSYIDIQILVIDYVIIVQNGLKVKN